MSAVAPLRLFLVLADAVAEDRAAACLHAFCRHADAASLLLPARPGVSQAFVQQVQALGLALLVAGDAAMVQRLGADGVHVQGDDAQLVASLRRRLGADMIVGACCPAQRHLAMELGEAGADYLGIDQRLEARGENLLAWWAQMFTVPVVAMHPVAPEGLAALVRMGADFAVPLADMWQDAEHAAALGEAYAASLQRLAQKSAAAPKTG